MERGRGRGGGGRRANRGGAGRWRDSGPLCDALPCARPAAGAGDGSPAFRPPRNPCWGHRSLLGGCLAQSGSPFRIS